MLFDFAFDYAIRWVLVKQDGSKLNGTQQLFIYAYDVNIFGGSVHTIKENRGFVRPQQADGSRSEC